jgi:hypothetical protein
VGEACGRLADARGRAGDDDDSIGDVHEVCLPGPAAINPEWSPDGVRAGHAGERREREPGGQGAAERFRAVDDDRAAADGVGPVPVAAPHLGERPQLRRDGERDGQAGIVVAADPKAAADELAGYLARVVAIADPAADGNAWSQVAAEVAAVRERVGMTEISNYAKYRVTGPGA